MTISIKKNTFEGNCRVLGSKFQEGRPMNMETFPYCLIHLMMSFQLNFLPYIRMPMR